MKYIWVPILCFSFSLMWNRLQALYLSTNIYSFILYFMLHIIWNDNSFQILFILKDIILILRSAIMNMKIEILKITFMKDFSLTKLSAIYFPILICHSLLFKISQFSYSLMCLPESFSWIDLLISEYLKVDRWLDFPTLNDKTESIATQANCCCKLCMKTRKQIA